MYSMTTHARLLGLITASAIFFQLYLELPAGLINLNLADPFALVALLSLSVSILIARKMPQWRIAEFNWILVLFGLLLLFAYVVGWMKIGNTQWALSARLAGWVVLLGYLSAGYLLVRYLGSQGIRRMLEVLTAAAVLVIVWQVVVRLLYGYGFAVQEPTVNFEGFSGNRNAFAFQLLTVLALYLPYSKIYAGERAGGETGILKNWRSWLPLGVLIIGIFWTASRAGMLTAAIMTVAAYYRNVLDRRSVFMGILSALLLWGIVWALQNPAPILTPVLNALETAAEAIKPSSNPAGTGISSIEIPKAARQAAANATVQTALSSEGSNAERWATLNRGFQMWRNSPLVGEGLGVFIATSAERFGHPTVIHSTPIWILAEFGLLGVAVLGWSFLKLWRYSIKSSSSQDDFSRAAFLLLLIAFAVFSQFHEVLFQRIIWLVGGVLLGLPLGSQTATSDQR